MPDTSCIFCRIVRGEIPCEFVVASERVVVFRDISPKAPVHLLAIPKEHVVSLRLDPATAGEMTAAIEAAADKTGIKDGGYRVVVNQGRNAGQEVEHLHFHILGGRALAWPPG
jgi:histidine triad (HIT) family protein